VCGTSHGKHVMAEMLLEHGADPNGRAYASGTPLPEAYGQRDEEDEEMVARLERDDLLKSTPLGWACRWGREELVRFFLERGADPVEPDAESWAPPLAWAQKKGHHNFATIVRQSRRL